MEWRFAWKGENPSTAWRRSPSPFRGGFLKLGSFGGWNGGMLGWVEPLHHLAVVPLPFQGRLLGGEVLVLRWGLVWEVGPLHRLAAVPLP